MPGVLQIHKICRRRTQNHTLLLYQLVMALEDHLVDAWAWQVEDVACKDVWDQMYCNFWAQLLALEHDEHVETL